MMIFTPKVGRLLALDGVIDQALTDAYCYALDEAKERGAHDVLRHIMEDCTKVTESDEHGWKVKRFSIRVVVLSDDELRQELENAYRQGMCDGRQPGACVDRSFYGR
jgi:hypothetical protein